MKTKFKKFSICMLICFMSVFMIAAMKPEEVKAETDALSDSYVEEYFKKMVYLMQKYVDPEYYRGNYPTSCWKMIDGKWYAFDARGYMRTGWIQDGGSWYYLYSNGKMASNTWIGNYYVNASGAWVQ